MVEGDQIVQVTIIIGAAIIGGFVGYVIWKINNRRERSARKILKDPKLLEAELTKQGRIFDMGQEVHVSMHPHEKTGKPQLDIKVSPELPPQPKPIEPKQAPTKPSKQQKKTPSKAVRAKK